jgi:type IV secretory pathway VirB9-like protein
MKKKAVLFFSILTLATSYPAYSQDEWDDENAQADSEESDEQSQAERDGPDAPPAAPINQFIPLLAIAGAIVVYRKVKKRTKVIDC